MDVSDPPTQAEVQALRDKAEEVADDARAMAVLTRVLSGALASEGLEDFIRIRMGDKGVGVRKPLQINRSAFR